MADYVVNKDAQPGGIQTEAQILLTPATSGVTVDWMDSNGVVQSTALPTAAAANNAPTWSLPVTNPGFPGNSIGSGVATVNAWVDEGANKLMFNITYDDGLGSQKTGEVALL